MTLLFEAQPEWLSTLLYLCSLQVELQIVAEEQTDTMDFHAPNHNALPL